MNTVTTSFVVEQATELAAISVADTGMKVAYVIQFEQHADMLNDSPNCNPNVRYVPLNAVVWDRGRPTIPGLDLNTKIIVSPTAYEWAIMEFQRRQPK